MVRVEGNLNPVGSVSMKSIEYGVERARFGMRQALRPPPQSI